MSSLINNFSVFSTSLSPTVSTITFSFDQIIGENIGAYRLYKSYSPTGSMTYETIIIDASSVTVENTPYTRNVEGVTYFTYTVPEVDYGKIIYYALSTVTRLWVEGTLCNNIQVSTYPNAPTSFFVSYDNYDLALSWSAPVSVDSSNSDISNYLIRKANCLLVTSVALNDSGNLSHSLFSVNSRVLVIDIAKKSCWYGECLTAGEFILDEASRFPYIHDDSGDYEVSLNNLKVYIEKSFEQIVLLDANTFSFTDTTFTKNSLQFYAISALCGSQEGPRLYYPVFTPSITSVAPYLRNVSNSDNTYLASTFWKKLKNVLTDSNYYNKQAFDIPHIKGMYTFSGYLGLYNCKVDIYVNDTYTTTVLSDEAGGFTFNVHLTKSNSKLQIQARDYKNIGFSIKSNPQIIRLVTIYSFFSALAQEYNSIWEEILLQLDDFSFESSRTDLLEDKLSPFVDMTKNISETDADYKTYLIQAYLAYEYAGYHQSLFMLLDAMKSVIPQLDHYEVFFRDTLMDTHRTGRSFVINDDSAKLPRKNYIYAVTSVDEATGEESGPAVLRVDNRWWPTELSVVSSTTPVPAEDFQGFNCLTWTEALAAQLVLIAIYGQDILTPNAWMDNPLAMTMLESSYTSGIYPYPRAIGEHYYTDLTSMGLYYKNDTDISGSSLKTDARVSCPGFYLSTTTSYLYTLNDQQITNVPTWSPCISDTTLYFININTMKLAKLSTTGAVPGSGTILGGYTLTNPNICYIGNNEIALVDAGSISGTGLKGLIVVSAIDGNYIRTIFNSDIVSNITSIYRLGANNIGFSTSEFNLCITKLNSQSTYNILLNNVLYFGADVAYSTLYYVV